MTNYEKYQLQWMIDHDISLTDLINDMRKFVHSEVDKTHPYSCDLIKEAYEFITNEVGFAKNDMCFVCEEEWNDEEKTYKRIEQIQKFRKDNDTEEMNKKLQEIEETKKLNEKILNMKPRIQNLIKVANECRENKIRLEPELGYGGKGYKYEDNNFIANGITHHVGFVEQGSLYNNKIKYIGSNHNDAGINDSFYLLTDGDVVFFTKNPKYVSELGILKNFSKQFDEFESKFYAYVDQTVNQSA